MVFNINKLNRIQILIEKGTSIGKVVCFLVCVQFISSAYSLHSPFSQFQCEVDVCWKSRNVAMWVRRKWSDGANQKRKQTNRWSSKDGREHLLNSLSICIRLLDAVQMLSEINITCLPRAKHFDFVKVNSLDFMGNYFPIARHINVAVLKELFFSI